MIIKELDISYSQNMLEIEINSTDYPWSLASIQGSFNPNYFVIGAIVDENLCGFAISQIIADESTLQNICVEKKYQGHGYGKELLIAIINNCKKYNVQNIFLEVRESNTRAQSLYEKFDFIQIGVRPQYYPYTNSKGVKGFEDAISMGLYLG